MEAFRRAAERLDADALVALLAEDVTFKSPVVFKPYRGKEVVGAILRAVTTIFSDFRYEAALESGDKSTLVFKAKVGDREVEGVDYLELDGAGKVRALTVFVRPLSAAHAVAEAMQAALGLGKVAS
jgi:hypothetical protein